MATVEEMRLLHGSMAQLGDTFGRNRDRAENTRQFDLDRAMRAEEMGLRREDQQDSRNVRREGMQLQASHQEALRKIQEESKALQAKHYEDMKRTGLLTVLQKGLADGTVDIDKLKASMADNPLLKAIGLGVDVFKAQAGTKEFQTRDSHNLKLAEELRAKAAGLKPQAEQAADRRQMQTLKGDRLDSVDLDGEMERLLKTAERLERGVGREEKDNTATEVQRFSNDGYPQEREVRGPLGSLPPFGSPATNAAAVNAPKKLTLEQARDYLKQAGGDKEKARALAKAAGYEF